MRKFIINIIFCSLTFVILCLPVDFYISAKLKKTNKCTGEFEVWNAIYSGEIKSSIAIFGSSRAWVHIDPEIIEDSLKLDTYNFGIDGHNFWLQYLRYKEYRKNNTKPKIILYSVDVLTLQKKEELYNMSQFLPYMLWNIDIYKSTSTYKGYTFFDYFIPLIRFRHNTEIITSASKDNHLRKKGYKGVEKKWNSDFDEARKIKSSYTAKLDTASIKLFEHFLKSCKSEKIEVILIYTPEYIDGQKYVSNRQQIIKLYEKLSHKYRIPFLNYSNNYLCYDKKYFYNSLHLNSTGADIFSKILAADLIKTQKNYTYAHPSNFK